MVFILGADDTVEFATLVGASSPMGVVWTRAVNRKEEQRSLPQLSTLGRAA